MHISSGGIVAEATYADAYLASRQRSVPSGAVQPNREPVSKQKLRIKIYLGLVVLDCLGVAGAFLFADYLRFGDPFAAAGMNLLAVLLPIFALSAFNMNAYGLEVLGKPRVGIFRSILALCAAVGVVLLAAFFLKASADFSRVVLGVGAVGGIAFIGAGRMFLKRLTDDRLGTNPLSEVLIVDGVPTPETGGARVVHAGEADIAPNPSDPLMLHRLALLLKGTDRVLIACRPERRALWAMLLKGANIQGEVLASDCEEVGVIGIGRFTNTATMVVSCGPLDIRSRALKRVLDLAVTLPVVAFVAPLMLLVACAIKLESRGPIFFVQKRLGRGNQLFSMLKFRSMRAEACDADGSRSTGRDDDRVTRVGRFIRSTSIDELPQLLNVIRGEMSLVGPRPHALGSLAGSKLFWEVDERYWHRHACKPGITGLAQVRGFRGATHESTDLANRLRADLEYLSGWSIWRDVAILFRTFRVLVHKNAF